MDNQVTLATVGTQDAGRRQTKQKTKHNAETDGKHKPHQQTGLHASEQRCSRW